MTESSHSRFGDSSETIVRLRGVSRSYSPNTPPALVPTDLDIREGEFFSLLGPSGSGKTTTLRLIAGFEAPDSGKVFIDSEDVTRIPPYRRNTNTVFQNYALFPHMTIAENVAYPLRMRGEDRGSMGTRVGEALELVNMTGFDDRLPHMLSGGQRQRVALARAIVGRPRVLLLDEPLGALDLKLRQQMQHALTALQRELGITFIFVTHDQGEALSMSNQVAVMNEGRVEQVGTPWELYYKPHSAFVANFIGQSNIIEVFAENSGGETRFRIGSISVASPPGTNLGPYRIGLRYEAILIARDAHELTSDVIFDARVDDVLFLGSSVEYTLKAEGVELMALARSQKDLVLKRGQKIAAGFNTSDLVVLDD